MTEVTAVHHQIKLVISGKSSRYNFRQGEVQSGIVGFMPVSAEFNHSALITSLQYAKFLQFIFLTSGNHQNHNCFYFGIKM